MPAAAYLTLISLGLFALSSIHYGARILFSRTRLLTILMGYSVACLFFSLVQTFHVLDPVHPGWIAWTQIGYAIIVLLNPLLLQAILQPGNRMRVFLKTVFLLNALVLLILLFAALFRPDLITAKPAAGGWDIGYFQYVRATAAMANWVIGFAVMMIEFRRNPGPDGHRYLFLGYTVLVMGSLFDAVLISGIVWNGVYLFGFYPGLLCGLLIFHVTVTLSLSRSYRDREEETESSVHAMEESKKELMRMAYYDDMTGRPNRKSFLLHLNHHIIETLSLGKMKAVFLLDLDNFRDVNDTFGYTFGDLVIRNVGEKIEDRFGVRDRLYRLYGNQFAIIWDDVRDRGHALDLARVILDDLTSLVEIDDANLYMGVSLGAVLLPDDGDDVNEVFRRCESALAEAKRDKNTFFFYSSELESRTRRKMSIVNSLREALKKDQFSVVYQPIVRADGSLAEMEALIRCSHPALKDVSPEVFIAVAESSGLIIPLTWWLIERVAADANTFAERVSKVRININMSPKILKSRDLVDRIVTMSETIPVNGLLVGFEITEGAIIENVEQVLKNLRALRERGYLIALDDFGTGYSSLSYIKNLPLDKIKIDKRFVSGISRDTRDEALINSIVSIAENLQMELVAEGVEMPNQLAYLNDRGCQFYQGYLFSRPVSLEEVIENYTD